MIKIEDFNRINFKVGEIKNINKNNIKIMCDNKIFNINLKLNVEKGNKIVFIIEGNKLIIPIVDNEIPLIPEKDIEVGSKIR